MRKSKAAVGTSLFFALVPGVVAGLVPWLLTGWEVHGADNWSLLRLPGLFLVAPERAHSLERSCVSWWRASARRPPSCRRSTSSSVASIGTSATPCTWR